MVRKAERVHVKDPMETTGDWKSRALLTRLQNDTTTLEESLMLSYEVKHTLIIQLNNLTYEYLTPPKK